MVYLALAICGAIFPVVRFVRWLISNSFDPTGILAAWQAQLAGSWLAWDLAISVIALIVFVTAEVAVRRNWIGLVAIPATVLIGVGCGLPLYLFLRTRPVV